MSRNCDHSTRRRWVRKGESPRPLLALADLPADAAGRRGDGRGERAEGPYLEISGSTVDGREGEGGPEQHEDFQGSEGWDFECRAVGCRCRFCPHCCKHLGLKLREALTPVLKTFTRTLMLTLTIDPKLFDSPEAAYWYCRERRAIAELVRALWKAGHLKSRRFFYVVEWHKNGWAHFHVLVESEFIPNKVLWRFWGRNRPKSAPAWEGSYAGSMKGIVPEFGTAHISKRDFDSPEHAVNYALKYMLKLPEQGYPDWVLDSTRQVRMFSTSRGLLPGRQRKAEPVQAGQEHAGACEGADRVDSTPEESDPVPFDVPPPERKTIRGRLKACGESAALFRRRIERIGETVISLGRREFMQGLNVSFREVLRMFGLADSDKRAVRVEWHQLDVLTQRGPLEIKSVVAGGIPEGEAMRHAEFDEWNKACELRDKPVEWDPRELEERQGLAPDGLSEWIDEVGGIAEPNEDCLASGEGEEF